MNPNTPARRVRGAALWSRGLAGVRSAARGLPVALAVASVLVAVLTAAGAAQAANPRAFDPRLGSAGGLGPRYTGVLSAGLGMSKPNYGFEAGEFIIQPRFLLEGEFTSNFFRVDTRSENLRFASEHEEEYPVFTLHLRPGIAIFNPTYDVVAMTLGVDLNVLVPLTDDEDVLAHVDVGVAARAGATFFPRGVVSFTIEDTFGRDLFRPPTITTVRTPMTRNSLGADVAFHPGGRAIDISLGYRWKVERFDSTDTQDRDAHHFRLLGSWKFFPLTYAYLETTLDLSSYARDPMLGGNFLDSMPVKVNAGVQGYITDRFTLLAQVGYGNSLLTIPDNTTEAANPGVNQPEDFSSVLFKLQGTYRFTDRMSLHLGGGRSLDPVAFGGHRSQWQGFTSFEMKVADLALIRLDAEYQYRSFGLWLPQPLSDAPDAAVFVTPALYDPTRTRNDHFLTAGVLVDFDISRIFGISAGYRFEGVFSDFYTADLQGADAGSVTLAQLDDADTNGATDTFYGYQEHRVFVTFNLRY